MNSFQLADLVIAKEITLEDALEMCENPNEFLNILKIRKDMKQALISAAYYRKAMKSAKTAEDFSWMIQVYDQNTQYYANCAIKLEEESKLLEARIHEFDGNSSYVGQMLINDIISLCDRQSSNLLYSTKSDFYRDSMDYYKSEYLESFTDYMNESRRLKKSAIIGAITSIIDYLAEQLGN